MGCPPSVCHLRPLCRQDPSCFGGILDSEELWQAGVGRTVCTNTWCKTPDKTRFLLQYPRLKVTKKIRVKSPSTRDFLGLPSILPGWWPFPQGLAVWFRVSCAPLTRPSTGLGVSGRTRERESQHSFHFSSGCCELGQWDFPGCRFFNPHCLVRERATGRV